MKICASALQPGDVLVSFRSPVVIAAELTRGDIDIQNCVNLNTTEGYFTFPLDLTVEIEGRAEKTEFNVPDGFVLVPEEQYRALVNAAQEPSSSYSIAPVMYVVRDDHQNVGIYKTEKSAQLTADIDPRFYIAPLFDLSDNCLGNLLRAASRQIDLARTQHNISIPFSADKGRRGVKECEDLMLQIEKLFDTREGFLQ